MGEQGVINRSSRVQARRIKMDCEIAIRPPNAVEPVRVMRLYNMSMTGMFICAESLLSPGTLFSFEIMPLADGKPIHGKAQVVWVRQASEGPNHQAGMGAHFHALDEVNTNLLRQLVESHQADNATRLSPADQLRRVVEDALSDAPAGGVAAAPRPASQRRGPRLPVARPARPLFGPSVAKSAKERTLGWWPLLIVLLLGLGATSFWLMHRGGSEPASSLATRPAEAASPVAETAALPTTVPTTTAAATRPAAEPPVVASAAPAAAVNDAVATPPVVDPAVADSAPPPGVDQPPLAPLKDARRAIEAWAAAWSDQRVDDYLAAYASGFVPPRGRNRAQWSNYRRDRLGAPSFISVRLSQLDITRQGDERARAVFHQDYRSNTISDVVEKTLELVWEEGSWRILSETSKPVS